MQKTPQILKLSGKTAVFIDYTPLYQFLIQNSKQIVVIYSKKHIGREVWEIKKGLFKIQFNQLPI